MSPERDVHIEAALAKLAEGDTFAFADIVEEHQAMVFSLAYHFLQNRCLAEDLAQEVFLSLFQNLKRIETPTHLTHWLRRVVVHRCVDQRRRQRPEVGLDQVAEPGTAGVLSDYLLAEHLQRTIALLPERQRMMVVLRYQEGLDPAEISELLAVPVNTVKSSLQRALAELRKILTRHGEEARYALF
ncbi:MAG: RNA polymerase sigma factor SigW [Candidatus Acidiferrum sp.]